MPAPAQCALRPQVSAEPGGQPAAPAAPRVVHPKDDATRARLKTIIAGVTYLRGTDPNPQHCSIWLMGRTRALLAPLLRATAGRPAPSSAAPPVTPTAELDDAQRDLLVDAMFERRCAPGQALIREGDPGDFFYVVDRGRFVAAQGGRTKFVYDGAGAFLESWEAQRAAGILKMWRRTRARRHAAWCSPPDALPTARCRCPYPPQAPLASWPCSTTAPAPPR